MKKISMIFLCLLTIVLITGCNNSNEDVERKLICTTVENEDGMNVEQVISMTYKNNKLNHMTMEVNTTISDSTVQENWELFKSTMDENNKEFIEYKEKENEVNFLILNINDILKSITGKKGRCR